MNAESFATATNLYATRLLGAEPADWRCTGCDPNGLDLQAGDKTLLAGFSGAGDRAGRAAKDAGQAGGRGAGQGIADYSPNAKQV